MTVSVNKKEVYQGNAKPVTITVGATGTLTTVVVTMTSNSKKYIKTLSIRPQDVVIVAEPLSTAPALYEGKPLIPLEGSVRVVAIANVKNTAGKAIDQSKLSYVWTVDNTTMLSASGIGKDTIVVASPLQYRERGVSVKVMSQDGSVASGAALSLSPHEPTVRMYESDPLLGVLFDKAIYGTHNIVGGERSMYGVPYSFSTTKGSPTLQWFLNGTAAQTGPSITLRPTGSGAGNASLSLVASAGGLTTASANLSLSFGSTPKGGGLFGP